MNKFKKFVILLFVALIIQAGALVFINRYIAKDTISTLKKVEVKKDNLTKKNNININTSSQNLKISYDGKYIAYSDNGSLSIIDITSGKSGQYKAESNAKPDFYKWLPSKDSLVVSEVNTQGNSANIRFYLYDIEKGKKEAICGETSSSAVSMSLNDKSSHITEILFNSKIQICYAELQDAAKLEKIYKTNSKSEMEQVKVKGYKVGNIAMIKDKELLYEDLSSNKIRMENGTEINVLGIYKYVILSIDNNDNIYVGSIDKNNKVKAIFYGMLNEKTDKWKSISLDEPIGSSEIYVSPSDGTIFINNNLKGSVKNIYTKKETYYKGLFIQIFNKGIASTDDNKLSISYFNSNKN